MQQRLAQWEISQIIFDEPAKHIDKQAQVCIGAIGRVAIGKAVPKPFFDTYRQPE